ncbi:hypothetical protein DL96DRAFT_1716585 [Flagelloscypha sp. PMI_526]|nr:hypothetical protein DL96DRAFT_1716585 [Flagelloscypha sp. PMI_526]
MASDSAMILKTVNVPNYPVSFTYLDSGHLESSSYTTIFFLHGYIYHASICEPLLPLAAAHNLRFSRVAEEAGLYLALAIDALIVELGLPEEADIALCAWSLGTVFFLAILDAIHSEFVNEEMKERFRKFLRCLIVYDHAGTLGIPLLPDQTAYFPLSDPTIPDEDKTRVLEEWISSLQHDETHPHSFQKLNDKAPLSTPPATLPEIPASTKERLTHTTATTTLSELHAIEQRARPDLVGLTNHRVTYFENRRTLGKEVKKYVVYGSMSAWTCVWPAWWLEIEGKDKDNITRRMEGANHLMTWDQPSEFLTHVRWCIDHASQAGCE